MIAFFAAIKGWLIDKAIGWIASKFGPLLRNSIYKDGKPSLKRSLVVLVLVLGSALFYWLPEALVGLSSWLNKDISYGVLGEIYSRATPHTAQEDKGYHYFYLLKSALITFYLFVISIVGLYVYLKKNNQLQQAIQINKKEWQGIADFAKAVKLVGGVRPITEEGNEEARNRIRKAMRESRHINLMLINGSSIFSNSENEFFDEIKKSTGKKIRVLLLDPLSKYAEERAKVMKNEIGADSSAAWDKYILDFSHSEREIKNIAASEWNQVNSISHKIHCSRPFFRFYIFDNDAFIQTYDQTTDGHKSPIYHVEKGPESLYSLAFDMFYFYWARGFSYETTSHISDSLAIYLAKMHGVQYENYINNTEELKAKIIRSSMERIESARNRAADIF